MQFMKKSLALLLALLMVLTLFSFLRVEETEAVSYNTGKKGVVCTSLSSAAKAYYTGSYTYSKLSAMSSSTLKSSLKTLMTNTQKKVTTYNELRTYTKYSDANPSSSGKILLWYTGDSVTGTWDSGKTWNREHVWPQSLGTFTTSNAGSDLHHLRPADPVVNSTRGNKPYGEVSSGTTVKRSATGTVAGVYNSTYFEPNDHIKGDIARVLMYVYVRWGETNLTDVIQSKAVLLNWNKLDPVDCWEMGRNDVIQSIQGNRNVFIDYPEFCYTVLGYSIPSGLVTPTSGSSSSSGSGSSSGGGSSSSGSSSTATTGTYKLVTDISQVTNGNYIIVGVNGSYTGALKNSVSSGYAGKASVSISNNTITNPDASIVWKFTETSTADRFKIYNEASGKYLQIAKNATAGFSLSSSCSYYFNLSSAAAKATNAVYLKTTYTGNRCISLYQSDFRAYTTSSYKPLYLYKEVTSTSSSGSGSSSGGGSSSSGSTSSSSGNVYRLVTNVSQVTDGYYLIVGINGSYSGALTNSISSGYAGKASVTISNNTITNPPANAVWKFTETSKSDRFKIYSPSSGKYLQIAKNSTAGFSTSSSCSYYFDLSSAAAKATYAVYLKTTYSGNRCISIYQSNFRAYATSSYKPLYLFKLDN